MNACSAVWKRLPVAGILVVLTTQNTRAQSGTVARATITVPPIMQVRSASTITTLRVNERLVEVTQRVVTAANASYSMTVMPSANVGENSRGLSRVFVRVVDGAFVPLEAAAGAVVARGERGPASLTSVVFRIESAGGEPPDLV